MVLLILCCAYGDEKKRQAKPPRYRIEVMYTIHKNVRTDQEVQRIVDLFSRTYPHLDAPKLQATVKEMKEYFGIYRHRLLKGAGTSWKQIIDEVEARERKDDDAEVERPNAILDDSLRQRVFDRGYSIVKSQVSRELTVRAMYQWLRHQARDDESLKDLYDKLEKHDGPKQPICSTEPGKGLIVYRDFGGKALTGKELEEIEDRGVRFTHTFRARVQSIGHTALPRLARMVDVLSAEGNGWQIVRLLAVVTSRLKTARHQTRWIYRWSWHLYQAIKSRPDALAMLRAFVESATDPWGQPFALEMHGDGGEFRVVSRGPDGELGTDDDIRYPSAKEDS